MKRKSIYSFFSPFHTETVTIKIGAVASHNCGFKMMKSRK